MQTTHRLLRADARDLRALPDRSVDLVVTSPPYPMIAMWDRLFAGLSQKIKPALRRADGPRAFDLMHRELDKIWSETKRVLKPGGFACLNIGDATRTLGGTFRLYSNHSRVISAFQSLRFDCLPVILWRKTTNAPNKFMGSGMLPAGAYVTLEHEYILIFRKAGKRVFKTAAEKAWRNQSAFFWEERNQWFSDIWDLPAVRQLLPAGSRRGGRERSAAFPFELAWRLINMYSLQGDTVLDPLLGTGTTMLAALAAARNSIGVEIDRSFLPLVRDQILKAPPFLNEKIASRLNRHLDFIRERTAKKKALKYRNIPHGFPVMTRQETGMQLWRIASVTEINKSYFQAMYDKITVSPEVKALSLAPSMAVPEQLSLPIS